VCNDFARGTCKRGDSCRYSHIGGPPSNAVGDSGYGSGYGGGGGGGRGSSANASDDWQCDGCGNSNFQWRKACKRCGAQKSKAVKDAEQKAAAGWLHAGLQDTSNRIFVQGFDPSTTSEDDLKELFSGIGVIARVRQRFGFPDQWPHAVKIYRDADGNPKDEAVIKYDDPMAAQSAPGFYDGHELNGKKLSVSIATSREDREGGGATRGDRGDRGAGGGGGGYAGGGRGYDDRRGGYDDRRGGDRGYDDRRGGDRHRPY
jgi:RNA-binding protein FUS